jgi:hypothetical protein
MRKNIWIVCTLAFGLTAAGQQAANAGSGAGQSQSASPPAAAAPAKTPPAAPVQTAPAAGVEGKGPGTGNSAAPEHPITVDQVHEMMRLTGSANLTKDMLDASMPTLRQSMPAYMPEDVLQDFEKTLLDGGVIDKMVVEAYQAHLSTDVAAEIIAFYKTDAGQRMLAVMPQIMKDTQAAGEKAGEQTMMDVLQRHKAEIDAAKQKYEQQIPPTAPKN